MKKKIVSVVLASVFLMAVLSMTGCASTWDGVGKDIEKIGKDIQS